MKIVYIGAETAGLECLKELLDMGEDVVAVFTKDDSFAPSIADFVSFDSYMQEHSKIPFYKVDNINAPQNVEKIKQFKPDLICVISWSWLISKAILDIPPQGCIGIHYSLLPKRRGGAPIAWAIIDGLKKSGISLIYYTERLDDGDIIAQKEFEITHDDTSKTVLDKINQLCVEIIRENIPQIRDGTVSRIPQNDEEATYTSRRKPEDSRIDWTKSKEELYNWIRALAPLYPPAFTEIGGKRIIIPEAKFEKGELIFKGVVE